MNGRPVMLIADNASTNRMVLKTIFSDQFNILESGDGAEVLSVIKHNPDIDVIILDVYMPKISGLDILRFIKSDSLLCHIPVIINSPFYDLEKTSLELGAADYIIRPYNPQTAKTRIMSALTKAALERTNLELELQNASQSFSVLSNAIPGGIAMFEITDDNISIVFYNDAFCSLSGRSAEEFAQEVGDEILDLISPDDRQRLLDYVRRIISEGGSTIQSVFRFLHRSGVYRWVKISACMYRNEKDYKLFIAVFIDITDEKEYERKLRHQADFDMLTDIYNRTAFCEKTCQLLHDNPDQKYALVFCDVDRFKVINDLFGSSTGDMVLINIAEILRESVTGYGTYGRLEADHFAFCIPKEYISGTDVSRYIKKCTEGLSINYKISFSFGIYEIDDIDLPVEKMCDRASLAIHGIKNNCVKKIEYYNKELRRVILDEQKIAAEMETALRDKQFVVYYQPVISVSDQSITAAEALIRWDHPKKGILGPGTFIPAFEKNGFVTKLDKYVWENVCIYLEQRMKAGEKTVPVSVNMSRVNVYDSDLCSFIIDLVHKYNIDPSQIRFEITESVFTENQEQLLNTVTTLRSYGFLILMDDFGSGYSSLNSLKDIPVDVLKIDRSFIIDIDTSDRALSVLKSVVYLARQLGIPVVAEGIETRSQFDHIRKLGCSNIQGFYFSKPLPNEEFNRYVDEHS